MLDECLLADVLIIGSGVAGGVAALELAEAGVDVTLVTRAGQPEESNTYYAQGGIIYSGVEDLPDLLAEDIIRAGASYSNPTAVHVLANEGPRLVQDILIDKIGVVRPPADARYPWRWRGGHSVPRIVHAADATAAPSKWRCWTK
jgi:L-aspartate oxidase